MSQSITRNFIYSSILTVSNYLFPLIVYPYVSRTLGLTNIGICNYVDNVINYFSLFSMMGISIMGIREIASSKSDGLQLSKAFTSLVTLNAIFTVVSIIGLIAAIYAVPSFEPYRNLLYIGVFKLLGNLMLIEWLFKGLEDFKYITNRTIFVKVLYIIAVFVFVRERTDYAIYYLLSVLMIFVNALFNCRYAWKVVSFIPDRSLMMKHLKPFLYLGAYLLITSMYTSFNVLYLKSEKGVDEVGCYTTATKLYQIILALFTAFTGVMMPRMSSLLSENRIDEFKTAVRKSVGILVALSVPGVMLTTVFSPQIIHIMAGGEFEGAIIPAMIVMPLLFVIGYEQILVIQILMPIKKDVAIFKNAIIGAAVSVLLNIILVPRIGAIGSAIVWASSELVVLLLAQYYVTKYIGLRFPVRSMAKNILVYLPLLALFLLLQMSGWNEYVSFAAAIILMVLYFILVQMHCLHDELVIKMINKVLRR